MAKPSLDRRTFLKLTAVVSAGLPSACSNDEDSIREDRSLFTHSVASGDPRSDSVVLWTRARLAASPDASVSLRLEVADDRGFGAVRARREGLEAHADNDHVVKVKVTGLAPRATIYYRFVAERDGVKVSSPVGRTRTAPAPDAATPVKLAFASCQDFVGRYYNAWQQLVDRDEDLDVVLFLGDYIYETTGDPSFMSAPGERAVTLSDEQGALALGGGTRSYRAARSLANYREIYRTYRADPVLQAVHERYPFIVVWDDHEFSDDCWGAHATYADGAWPEEDADRRRNAERAFFEYLPVDPPTAPPSAGTLLDPAVAPLYPAARIWRDFTFGAYLQLALLDCRSHRPDHLIPEDAYPGSVFLDAAALARLTSSGALTPDVASALASESFAYVDIDDPALAAIKTALVEAAAAEAQAVGIEPAAAQERARAAVRGALAISYINAAIDARNATSPAATAPLLRLPTEGAPRGIAFVHVGKSDLFASLGARYIVAKEIFELYAALRHVETKGESEDVLGPAQEAWLTALLASAGGARWTLVGSSVSMSELLLDLRAIPLVPEAQRARLLFSADQWDGFPNKKRELLAKMAASNGGRVVCVAGDIHAAFASVERSHPDALGVACLTAPAISSAAAAELTAGAVTGVGLDPPNPAVALLLANLDALFQQGNARLALADTKHHGLVLLEVGPDEILARYQLIPVSEVVTSYFGRAEALRAQVLTRTVRVTPGGIQLIG